MIASNNSASASRIRVKDINKSLEFYTKTLGCRASDALIRKDGSIAQATVGFESPLLILSPLDAVRTPHSKEKLGKNKLGIGVNFHFGMNGTMKLDDLYAKVKAKGITVVAEPKTEFGGHRIFTVKDPDGYHLTFSEHVQGITPASWTAAFETAHPK